MSLFKAEMDFDACVQEYTPSVGPDHNRMRSGGTEYANRAVAYIPRGARGPSMDLGTFS